LQAREQPQMGGGMDGDNRSVARAVLRRGALCGSAAGPGGMVAQRN
jgi:hypothetical protein